MQIHEDELETSSEAPKRGIFAGVGVHHAVMAVCMLAMGAGMWFFLRSGAGTVGYWPLFFLLCPLMHLFMGHGGHSRDR